MQLDPRKYVWDARCPADAIVQFTSGRSWEDFTRDLQLRSAVERQFEIIGEALRQLSRVDPALAASIPELPRIVAFRNILVHGYAIVDQSIVWKVIQENLPALRSHLAVLQGDD
jgi:uncharacterized protein with HEPN domain